MLKNKNKKIILMPQELIENKILLIRGRKVMIDADLAAMYQVKTMALNQAVKRNIKRFPEDFMFRLTSAEKEQVITNCDNLKYLKYSPHNPYVFTEPGVAMLSTVLNSEKAVLVNIQIIRTFIKIREMIISNKELRIKLEELENKTDKKFAVVFKAIANLIGNPRRDTASRKIGFKIK